MNDLTLGMLVGILAAMLLLSAFFSGSETSLLNLNRYRLRVLIKLNHSGAIKAYRLLQRPDRLLGLILLGNNFVKIVAASIATVIAIRLFPDNQASSIAIATGLLTLVILIFSEVTPKSLAAAKPEQLAFIGAWIYTPLLKLCYPIVWFVNLFGNLSLRLVGINRKKAPHEALDKDELKSIITEAESFMPVRYQKMLLGILDLESATVEDIMTPRNEVYGIDLELPIEKIVNIIGASPHTRLPVYKTSINRVIGILDLRHILALLNRDDFDKQTIITRLNKPFFIPENTSVHNQIQSFKQEKLRIGLVVDEYGDVQGLVTLDDLLQEIVGELITEEVSVTPQNDGSYLVDAHVNLRELNRITQWSLPTEGPKTLNGLIIEFMETIPDPGIGIKLYGHVLEIVERDNNAVKLVKFLPQGSKKRSHKH